MNATRATATMTTDGAVFGTTTETPPEDPPPGNETRDVPRWLIMIVLHLIVHIAVHYGRHEISKPTNQIPVNYVHYEEHSTLR